MNCPFCGSDMVEIMWKSYDAGDIDMGECEYCECLECGAGFDENCIEIQLITDYDLDVFATGENDQWQQ